LPGLQKELFRLLSRDIGHAERLAADQPAEARLAAFLLNLSARIAGPGLVIDRFRLAMSRGDIASYLRLAPETVSRLFRRLQDDALMRAHGREIEVLDRVGLERLAASSEGN